MFRVEPKKGDEIVPRTVGGTAKGQNFWGKKGGLDVAQGRCLSYVDKIFIRRGARNLHGIL